MKVAACSSKMLEEIHLHYMVYILGRPSFDTLTLFDCGEYQSVQSIFYVKNLKILLASHQCLIGYRKAFLVYCTLKVE